MFISSRQPFDTSTSTGRLMLAGIGAVGQAEREAMLERQREGIARAKAYKSRVPTARRQAAEIIRLKTEGVRPSEIATRLGIGRASVYRVLGERKKVAACPDMLEPVPAVRTVVRPAVRSVPLRMTLNATALQTLRGLSPFLSAIEPSKSQVGRRVLVVIVGRRVGQA